MAVDAISHIARFVIPILTRWFLPYKTGAADNYTWPAEREDFRLPRAHRPTHYASRPVGVHFRRGAHGRPQRPGCHARQNRLVVSFEDANCLFSQTVGAIPTFLCAMARQAAAVAKIIAATRVPRAEETRFT